jgi:hypothetical protein
MDADQLIVERYDPPPVREQPRPRPVPLAQVNKWGDTLDDQRRRRKALVKAMKEAPDER